jgi:peptidyl-prolyl cis-trans isomerase A (cyclophilin A)
MRIGAAAVAVVWCVGWAPAAAGAARQAASGLVRVALETEMGVIEIDVDTRHAPITSANFLRYVDAGLYSGGRFHRTVRPGTETDTAVPIQVIQAGRAPRTPGFPAIPLERTSTTGLKHVDGAVSMARSGADTATSDFFICIGDQPSLDDGGARDIDGLGFAVFGRVVTGMDVVRRIQAAPVFPGSQTLLPLVSITKASRRAAR